jgi:hypothetical protein
MKSILFAALLALSASQANANGVADTFQVDYVRVDANGYGYVQFTTPLVGTPAACIQPDYAKVLAFDTNTAAGKAILAVALQAKASDAKIYAKGTGDCPIYGVMEKWSWGYVQ